MSENPTVSKPEDNGSQENVQSSFEELLSDGKRQLDIANSSIQAITSFKDKLISGSTEEPSISSIIEETKEKVLRANILIEEYLNEIKTYKDNLFTGSPDQISIVATIESLVKKLEDAKETFDTKLNELNTLLSQTKEKSESSLKRLTTLGNQLTTLHTKLLLGSEGEESVQSLIDKFQKEAEEKTKEIGLKERDLSAFHDRVFGKKTDDGKQISGYQQDFEFKLKLFDTTHKAETSRFNELFKKIEGLLPGATSAGLAHAYDEQKNSYGSQIKLWQASFISTMVLMIGIGVWTFAETIDSKLSLSEALVSLIRKLPFFIPLIWLEVFSSKRLSQNKRMQQEYAFKETLAKSFDGHKNQIEVLKLANDGVQKELMAKLLTNLIEATGYNPSQTLDSKSHDEQSPVSEFLDKLRPTSKVKPS